MDEIKPGQGVAVFRMPLPMNGISILHDAIERIYGTGESMLTFNGDQIQVNAPAGGFGPVKSRKRPVPDVSDEGKTTHVKLRDGKFEITLEQSQDTVLGLMEATQKWFEASKGINYVEFRLQTPDGEVRPYYFCVQRAEGKSPHDLRLEAEAEAARLRQLVERVEAIAGLDETKPAEKIKRIEQALTEALVTV